MLKWSKYKTKGEVLADLKFIFDKYGITDVSTTNSRFWENGDIEHFFIDSKDSNLVKNLEDELTEYYFDLDEFPDGCCAAIVIGMDTENHKDIHEFYEEDKVVIYDGGKWVI